MLPFNKPKHARIDAVIKSSDPSQHESKLSDVRSFNTFFERSKSPVLHSPLTSDRSSIETPDTIVEGAKTPSFSKSK